LPEENMAAGKHCKRDLTTNSDRKTLEKLRNSVPWFKGREKF